VGHDLAKRIREITGLLEEQGWRIVPTRNSAKAYDPTGRWVVVIPKVPDDSRTLANLVSLLRSKGADIPRANRKKKS